MGRQRAAPNDMRDGWKILLALGACATTGGFAWWLLRRDLRTSESGSSVGNTAWMLGAAAALMLCYALYLVFRDVEEVVEQEMHDHREQLEQLESFEPTLFHWALAGAAVVVLVALVL